jgi:hypothetical protein
MMTYFTKQIDGSALNWADPLLLEGQLTPEERMVQEAAKDY